MSEFTSKCLHAAREAAITYWKDHDSMEGVEYYCSTECFDRMSHANIILFHLNDGGSPVPSLRGIPISADENGPDLPVLRARV